MNWGKLSTYFTGVAAKRLTAVEVTAQSNQHEFDGVQAFKGVLGTERTEFAATAVWFCDEEDKRQQAAGTMTWYDARERIADRSEFRLYYPAAAEQVVRLASPGDLLVLAVMPDRRVLIVLAPAGSTSESQLLWLFGLPGELDGATTKSLDTDETTLTATAADILSEIGLSIEESAPDLLQRLLERFGAQFPTTADMSTFARETAGPISSQDDPDLALVAWYEHEELLFRTLERYIVSTKLEKGFSDVDEFMAFSLSVQNRRKARAGSALENHIEQVFLDNGLRYSRGKITERKSRPDFVFPGIDQYRSASFPDSSLSMLAVKSTCKERWRQVLAEADRITEKHLLTLEPAISGPQTDEMQSQSVRLVVPLGVQSSYSDQQRRWLMMVREFIELVRARQPSPP